MFLARWNHHSSSSFRIQPWTINGFVQGKIQVLVFSQHLPLTVNIGCDSQPIHLVTYCNNLQIVCTIEQNHCRRGFYAMGFPFGYPWVESPGLSNLRNLYQHKPHEWTYSVLSEHYGKTSQILWKWWENAPNPVKIMGKRPKLRDSSSFFICPMKRNGYYSGSWSMVSKPPSRIQAGILVRSTLLGSSHYDSGFTIVGIYIRIPMDGFHDYIPIYDPTWVIYINLLYNIMII